MQRITLTLTPMAITGDDTSVLDFEQAVTAALLTVPGMETILVSGMNAEPTREGTCRTGGHVFHAPFFFPSDQPLPDICPDHARAQEDDEIAQLHQPLFTEITRLTGLHPRIWHSGGGNMTIVVPLTDPEPGQDWQAPCYMGLNEGVTDDGRWLGTVSFYATEKAVEWGPDADIVDADTDNPLHPNEWARLIAQHHATLTQAASPASSVSSVSSVSSTGGQDD
jgi:hypothetical protein